MNEYGSSYELKYDNGLEISSGDFNTMYKNLPFAHQKQGNNQLSVSSEPKIEYVEYEHYINVSSSNRDSVNYPLHYDYRINFDYPFKNIKKIELISAILPNQAAASSGGNILNESHLVVDVDEINYIEFPNNIGSSPLKGFAILPLKAPTQTTGGFINPELGCIYHKSRVFKTPLASLDHMTVKIRDYQGNLYDFGVTAGSTARAYQNHLVFKITVEETRREKLNHRNVY